jgi:transposase
MAHADWVRERMSAHGETTLDELCVALAERGIEIHRATVGRFLHRLGLSNKKKPQGKRAAQARDRQGS